MLSKNYTVVLDQYSDTVVKTPIVFYIGDEQVYSIKIRLLANKQAYIIPEDAEVYISFLTNNKLVDKNRIQIIDAQMGLVQHDFSGIEVSVPGPVLASIEIITVTEKLTWPFFEYVVKKSIDSYAKIFPFPYEEWTREINQSVIDLTTKFNNINYNGGSGIEEAPIDDQIYARKNSSWVNIDLYKIFDSYDDAQVYVSSNEGYAGQIISVKVSEYDYDAYIILVDNTLKKLGSSSTEIDDGSNGPGELPNAGTLKHNELINRNLPSQHNIDAIDGLRTHIDKLVAIPVTASSINKLVTQEEIGFAVQNIQLTDLVSKQVAPHNGSFIYFNNGQFSYKKEDDIKRYISSISDRAGNEYLKVDSIKFDNFNGSIENNQLKLQLAINTRDLPDMPKTHEHMRVLVSNYDKFIYELKLISELTHGFENYTEEININDIAWVSESDNRFSRVISHGLDSLNVIATFYDVNNMCVPLSYGVVDKASIKVFVDTKIKFRAVVNCSQGTSTQEASGAIIVDPYKFMDDNNVRVDRSYSSSKIQDLLSQYVTKSTTYTQNQAQLLFALKSFEHSHNNKAVIDRFSEDSAENLTYRGQRLITKIEPYFYERRWDMDAYDAVTEILDIKALYNSMGYKSIVNTEFSIKNELPTSDNEIANISNSLNLIVRDGSIEELNILILPQQVQRYILGISPNKKIFVRGSFSANFYISAF